MAARTFDKTVWVILDDVIALHGAEFGNLQLPIGDELMIAAQRGFKAPFLHAFERVKAADPSVCGRALRDGRPLVIADVEEDPSFAPFRHVAREAGYRAVQSAPLLTKDSQVMGVVSTHFANVHAPTQIEMLLLREYSVLAAERLGQLGIVASFADSATRMIRKIYPTVPIGGLGTHGNQRPN